MNKNLRTSFLIRDGKLTLCLHSPGDRRYRIVKDLLHPNLNTWNAKKQMFDGDTFQARYNNNILRDIAECCGLVLGKYKISNSSEFFNFVQCERTTRHAEVKQHTIIQEAANRTVCPIERTVQLADFDDECLFAELRRRGFTGELTYCRTVAV